MVVFLSSGCSVVGAVVEENNTEEEEEDEDATVWRTKVGRRRRGKVMGRRRGFDFVGTTT